MRSDGAAAASTVSALVFRAVGRVPDALLQDVAHRVSRDVGVPCRTGAAVADAPGQRIADDVPGRDQWDADRLLLALESQQEADGAVLVALAARDMGNAVFTHFFGRARLGGRVVLVSLARLAPDFYGLPADAAATARRAAREVLHELGHVAALAHCPVPACLMRLARNVEAIDVRGGAFCPGCAARFPRGLLRR